MRDESNAASILPALISSSINFLSPSVHVFVSAFFNAFN